MPRSRGISSRSGRTNWCCHERPDHAREQVSNDPIRTMAPVKAGKDADAVRASGRFGWCGSCAAWRCSPCSRVYSTGRSCSGSATGEDNNFTLHSLPWQTATVYFAVIDLVAAVGLWLAAVWGAVVWLTAAVSMAAVEVFFPQIYGGRLDRRAVRTRADRMLSRAGFAVGARTSALINRKKYPGGWHGENRIYRSRQYGSADGAEPDQGRSSGRRPRCQRGVDRETQKRRRRGCRECERACVAFGRDRHHAAVRKGSPRDLSRRQRDRRERQSRRAC